MLGRTFNNAAHIFPPQQVAFLFFLFLGLLKRKMRFRIGTLWKIEVK